METAHLEVLHEQRLYDIRSYGEYLQWYVPRTHAKLTLPPPERPEQVTHQESLRYSASRHDDTVRHIQPLVVSLMIFVLFVTEPVLYVTSV